MLRLSFGSPLARPATLASSLLILLGTVVVASPAPMPTSRPNGVVHHARGGAPIASTGRGSYDDDEWNDDDGSDEDGGGYDDASIDDGSADDGTVLGEFKVVGNQLDTRGASASTARKATAIWTRFATLIPAERRSMVSTFILHSDRYDGAYVVLDDNNTTWTLGVQDGIDDPQELDHMLVHEFGHLLTLNPGQIRIGVSARRCTTYAFEEGCARPDSIAARFVPQFWTADMRRRADDGEDIFRPGAFVTDYAATNPAEDLAETFAAFVERSQPTGSRVVDAKLGLFWSIPDLVQLRAQIRRNEG